jgi:TRAP-type C4-dicarboxylate transport system permease small subunit
MERFLNRLLQVETIVAGVFYVCAATILFGDVVLRELFGDSIWGGQRMAVLFANGSALIGLGVATALNRHIRPSVLDNLFAASWQPLISRLGHLFSAGVLFAGAYFCVLLVLDNKHMGFTTPPLDLEVWIPQLALPYGLASAGLRYLAFAIQPDLQPSELELS